RMERNSASPPTGRITRPGPWNGCCAHRHSIGPPSGQTTGGCRGRIFSPRVMKQRPCRPAAPPAISRFAELDCCCQRRCVLEHDPEKACPGPDPGWAPVFGNACPRARPGGSCSSNNVERNDDSKKSHLALARCGQFAVVGTPETDDLLGRRRRQATELS